MNCGLCEDCKWWIAGKPWGACERFCSERQMMMPGALARFWTTTKRGTVRFCTAADFGCVQWEAKTKEV